MIKEILEWIDRKLEERSRDRDLSNAEWKKVNGVCVHEWGIWSVSSPPLLAVQVLFQVWIYAAL